MRAKVTAHPVPPFHLRWLTFLTHTTVRKQSKNDQIKKTLVALIAVVSPLFWLGSRSDILPWRDWHCSNLPFFFLRFCLHLSGVEKNWAQLDFFLVGKKAFTPFLHTHTHTHTLSGICHCRHQIYASYMNHLLSSRGFKNFSLTHSLTHTHTCRSLETSSLFPAAIFSALLPHLDVSDFLVCLSAFVETYAVSLHSEPSPHLPLWET